MNTSAFIRALRGSRSRTWLWALFIFLVALVPRAFAPGRYVTPDEPIWVYRTLNFGSALARGDWVATAQSTHPGVTTMWLGSLGVALRRAIEPDSAADAINWLSKLDRLSPENIEAFQRLGLFVDWARAPVIVVNGLGVLGVFLLARRLFDRRTALLAASLLALDPFTAGLQGLFHVDGLLTTFSTLSLLALLNGIRYAAPPQPHPPLALAWFASSGAFAGLALLTKSPALFLTPFAALVLVIAAWAKRLTFKHALIAFLVFFILHFAFFILLYPAMWSDPVLAVSRLVEGAAFHATNATRPTFFDGQAELNLGAGFYPLALAYRLSPIVPVGLALAALRRLKRPRSSYSHTPLLIIFSVAFLVFLTPAAKKFDRYLLPAIPPLIIVAAHGFNQLSNQHTSQLVRSLPALTIILQALIILSVAPYPLMAYSPVLGGATGARDRIAVGWGEGFGAAAEWIDANDPGATVATGGLANFAPLYAGRTVTIDEAGLAAADYIVFTLSEVQLNPGFFAGLAQRGQPARTIRIGGVDAAWIVANAQPAAQAEWLRRETPSGDAILLDAPTPLIRLIDGLTVLPREATPGAIDSTLSALRDAPRIVHVSTAAASPMVRRDVRAWLDANARLEQEASIGGATIRVYAPGPRAAASLDAYAVQFDGVLELIGLAPLAESVAYPDRLDVAARWRVIAPPATNYSATLTLTDAGGNDWLPFGGLLRNASDLASLDWQPGEVFDQVFSIQPLPMLVPGEYRLRFGVERADGSRAALVSASGAFSGTAPGLASVQIDPARQSLDPGALPIFHRIEHAWPGQVELLGIDLLARSVTGGERVVSTVYWRSSKANLDPATEVRWLLEPESGGAPIEWRTPLAPNASAPLRNGDLIAVRYADRLPLDTPDGRYRLSLALGDEAVEADTLEIVNRPRAFDWPADAQPIGSLGAFDFYLAEPLPDQAHRGESFPVRVFIRAREEVLTNYTVFVHLLDPSGRVVAQIDTWPQGGAWPTADWISGQVVEDVYTLHLPIDAAPGEYRIAVGMYDALDGARLVTPDGVDRLMFDASMRVLAP